MIDEQRKMSIRWNDGYDVSDLFDRLRRANEAPSARDPNAFAIIRQVGQHAHFDAVEYFFLPPVLHAAISFPNVNESDQRSMIGSSLAGSAAAGKLRKESFVSRLDRKVKAYLSDWTQYSLLSTISVPVDLKPRPIVAKIPESRFRARILIDFGATNSPARQTRLIQALPTIPRLGSRFWPTVDMTLQTER